MMHTTALTITISRPSVPDLTHLNPAWRSHPGHRCVSLLRHVVDRSGWSSRAEWFLAGRRESKVQQVSVV